MADGGPLLHLFSDCLATLQWLSQRLLSEVRWLDKAAVGVRGVRR